MFCGNAAGHYIPPMVVYKAGNCWTTWKENGPEGAVYESTQSGWFDMPTFTIWFKTCFLPNIQQFPGRKIIIGDNLGCHFSEEVITMCKNNNIGFVPLIANSTHLTQPLDVSVFRPLKVTWSNILKRWRRDTRYTKAIPKQTFPTLLKQTYSKMKVELKDALVS
uniref:DDE-1 domain-containing protein n=1 Tax=Clytia hemisphaerica TaxID=252671 RepID=A0A7M5WZL5_9CNID